MDMLGLCEVYISHIQHNIENFSFYNTYVCCQSRLRKANHAYLIWLMLQWQLSHLNSNPATALMINLPDSEYLPPLNISKQEHCKYSKLSVIWYSSIQDSQETGKIFKENFNKVVM